MPVRMTAPAAVRRSVPWAMEMNRMVAAPPGSMMNGSRTPIRPTPTDCRIEPRPQNTKTLDSRAEESASDRFRALAIRKTDETGAATITRMCWMANRNSLPTGRIWSTGWISSAGEPP